VAESTEVRGQLSPQVVKSKAVADGLAHYKEKCRNLESQLLTANKMHASLLKQNEGLEKKIVTLRG